MVDYDLSHYNVSDPFIGGQMLVMWFQAGDGNMKAGYVCQDDDADEVKVCATDGQAFAVVGKLPDVDVDTAITSGDAMFVYLRAGTLSWLAHDGTNQTVTKGGYIARSDGTAGKVENFSYSDGTSELASAIGMGVETIATGNNGIWFKALLGL
jgi:hypothetical protein